MQRQPIHQSDQHENDIIKQVRSDYLRLRFHQNLTLVGDARQNTLLEDDHVVLGQPEVVVLLEELLRRLASRSTGHDIPRNNRLLAQDLLSQQLQSSNPLSLNLEKRLVARETNVKATLGVRATQTGTLTTRHQNHRNLVLRNSLETCIVPLLNILRVGVEDRGQSHVGERFKGRRALGDGGRIQGLLSQFVDTGGIEVGQLMVEPSLLGRLKFINEGEHLALSGVDVFLLELLELLGRGFRKSGFGVGLELAHEVGDCLFDSSSHFDGRNLEVLWKERDGEIRGIKKKGGGRIE